VESHLPVLTSGSSYPSGAFGIHHLQFDIESFKNAIILIDVMTPLSDRGDGSFHIQSGQDILWQTLTSRISSKLSGSAGKSGPI
jgi:hypothetical protein